MTDVALNASHAFNPKDYTRPPRLAPSDILPAERRLLVFFRWFWVPLVLIVLGVVALKKGLLGIPTEGDAYETAMVMLGSLVPLVMAFGLFLQIQSMPAEEAGKALAFERFAQSLRPLTLAQLDAIANEPTQTPETACMVKDEILRRVRT